MKNKLWKKGLVLGIIILFIGASGVSGVNRRINDLSNDVTKILDDVEDTAEVIEEQVFSDGSRQPLDSSFWWNLDWLYRKQITIDHTLIDDNLTNFPVLVSNISLDYVDHTQLDGDDFVFISFDNTIQYNHEIEYYNDTTGELVAWVNIPELSSIIDTRLYLYYGNPICYNQQAPEMVWDSDYGAVYHLDESSGTTVIDSTGNHNNGTYTGDLPTRSAGSYTAYRQYFDGSSDEYITFPTALGQSMGDSATGGTVELFKKDYDTTTVYGFITIRKDGDNNIYIMASSTEWLTRATINNIVRWSMGTGSGTRHTAYHSLSVSWKQDNVKLLLNGTVEATDASTGSWTTVNPTQYCMLFSNPAGNDYYQGYVEEIRLSTIARSAAWINASYNTMNDPESFLNIEEERHMIFVDDDFNESTPGWQINHFDTIQDGIDAVLEGGAVFVYNGTYYENVDITKNRINIIGEDRNSTIINGSSGNSCIYTAYTNNVTIQGFTFRDSIQGIKVVESYDFLLEDCIASNNLRGVYFHVSERMIMNDCSIHNNTEEGILIVNCDNSEIYNCKINDNSGTGISLEQHYTGICTDNRIYQNNLINNTINAFDDNEDTSNHWYLLYGNYYDDYNGPDDDGDGIGDTPYNISGGSSQDLYPLIDPWEQKVSLNLIYVNDDFNELTVGWGYNRFDNIHDGINAVLEHGTVFVYPGIYTEDLGPDLEYITIDKSLDLVGENKITTIINCPSGDTGIWIAPGLSNVNVSGFTILGANNTATRGIYPQTGSNTIRIEDCTVLRFDEGISVINSNYNITLSENAIYECADVGVLIENSNNCIISDNTIIDNNDGIRLDDSDSNVIEYNTIIENNKDGLWLISSVENVISNNNVSLNYEDNIHIGGGSNINIISNNAINLSECGVGLIISGDNNQIYHNNIVDNVQNAGDDGYGNTWDNGYPSGGNYWSDYTGEDNNGDGIGDTPYTIPGTASNQDLYPFMEPNGWQQPSNLPPYVPSNPYPEDGATNLSINIDLSWTGGDPDGDPVTYDVYFGDTSPPPQMAWNHTDTTYELDALDYETTYYWKILSWDNHSASAEGPIWDFTTETNYPPVFGSPTPANGSTGNLLSFTWSIPINDPEGDSFNWDIECSNGQSNGAIGDTNGTKTLALTGLSYSTTYTVWVNATDPGGSGLYTREWYSFTTKANVPPSLGIPDPANGSTGQPLAFTWSIEIFEPDDFIDWSIECSNGHSNGSTNDNPGTKSLTLFGLSYSTSYTVWVNVTDGYAWVREWFIFTTKVNTPPNSPSDPDPYDSEEDVDVDRDLSWSCSDPDGDDLTYDIYFEADDPTPDVLVSDDQTETTFDPGTLQYETTYYWQIIAEDEFGAVTDGPIWSFTTEIEPVPDLDCSGTLSWIDVTPGDTVTGEFTVENIGETLSLLDWEIQSYPDWGNWSFNPESGTDLLSGETSTIDVEVVAPDEQEETFTGEIKIINSENVSDYCIIDVSLATPVSQFQSNQQIPRFLQSIIERYPILRQVLGL